MIYIAHRGNVNGQHSEFENSPMYVADAIERGFDVEIDVWMKNDAWWLGHDNPTHAIDANFLLHDRVWCHAKDLDALQALLSIGAHCFWHQNDDVTLTSSGYMWTYPGIALTEKSICVMPERANYTHSELASAAGVCSDDIISIKNVMENL